MIILSKILRHIYCQLELLKDEYAKQIDLVDGDIVEIKNCFIREYSKILIMIDDERTKLLYNISTKILANQASMDNIEMFTDYCSFIKQLTEASRITELIVAKQSDFIYNYFELNEKKLLDLLDTEQWNFTPQKVSKYYLDITILLENYINPAEGIPIHEKARIADLEASKTDEENSDNLLSIAGKKFKIFMTSIFEIIEFCYKVIRDRPLFDPQTWPLITNQLMKILISFSRLNHDIVLEAKGFKLKSITPKEVSILCSNINIIKHFITLFILYEKDRSDNILKEALTVVNEILSSAKSKFIEVYFPQT
jgi:hypothetical protein